jgi:hypothetical protein
MVYLPYVILSSQYREDHRHHLLSTKIPMDLEKMSQAGVRA